MAGKQNKRQPLSLFLHAFRCRCERGMVGTKAQRFHYALSVWLAGRDDREFHGVIGHDALRTRKEGQKKAFVISLASSFPRRDDDVRRIIARIRGTLPGIRASRSGIRGRHHQTVSVALVLRVLMASFDLFPFSHRQHLRANPTTSHVGSCGIACTSLFVRVDNV